MERLGKSRKPLKKETSLEELSKPSNAFNELISDAKNIGKTVGNFEPIIKSKTGGALSMAEISEDLERRGTFERITANEMERQRFAPGEIIPTSSPNIAGVSDIDALVGYQTTTKPYDMRCQNGHLVPAGSNIFTDGLSYYCPYDGKKLSIA